MGREEAIKLSLLWDLGTGDGGGGRGVKRLERNWQYLDLPFEARSLHFLSSGTLLNERLSI